MTGAVWPFEPDVQWQ